MKLVYALGWIWAMLSASLVVGGAIGHAGESGDFANSFPKLDPCSLLSSTEISAATGLVINEGAILFSNGATAGCSFERAGGGRIALFIRLLPNAKWASDEVERMRRGVSFGSYGEVDAIGERAFILAGKSAGAALCVFQNPYYLQISVLGGGDRPQLQSALEKLAGIALRRLPSTAVKSSVARIADRRRTH